MSESHETSDSEPPLIEEFKAIANSGYKTLLEHFGVNEVDVKSDSMQEPTQSADMRDAVRNEVFDRFRFWLPGRDDAGNIVADPHEDLKRLHAVQETLVVDSDAMMKELFLYFTEYDRTNGDFTQMDMNKFKFIGDGGHLESTPFEHLQILNDERGYSVLGGIELDNGKRLPITYIYGLLNPREREDREFPHHDVGGLQPDGETTNQLLEMSEKNQIVYNVRTGVAKTLDQDYLDAVSDGTIALHELPEVLRGESMRRLHIGTGDKLLVFCMAEALEKLAVLLNVASIQEPLGRWMPNYPSMLKNSALLNPIGPRYERHSIRGAGPDGTMHEQPVVLSGFAGDVSDSCSRAEKAMKKKVPPAFIAYIRERGKEFADWLLEDGIGQE